MASSTALQRRVKRLELKIRRLERQAARDRAEMQKCCRLVVKWINKEVSWSQEVSDMMREINWALLATVFDGSGGTNPPQQPPAWPPA